MFSSKIFWSMFCQSVSFWLGTYLYRLFMEQKYFLPSSGGRRLTLFQLSLWLRRNFFTSSFIMGDSFHCYFLYVTQDTPCKQFLVSKFDSLFSCLRILVEPIQSFSLPHFYPDGIPFVTREGKCFCLCFSDQSHLCLYDSQRVIFGSLQSGFLRKESPVSGSVTIQLLLT